MAVPGINQPAPWKSDQNGNAKWKREFETCEKENRSLNNLVAHIGEAVIRHVKSKK
jgi:hypothetical protein